MKKILIMIMLLLFATGNLLAQALEKPNQNDWIEYPTTNSLNSESVLNSQFSKSNSEFKLFLEKTDDLEVKHQNFQQFFKGIKIEGSAYSFHFNKENSLTHSNGHIVYDLIDYSKNVLTEGIALERGLSHLPNKKYGWQLSNTEKELQIKTGKAQNIVSPKGELIYVDKSSNQRFEGSSYVLTYKFSIFSQEPFENFWLYVNANTGEIVKKISQIHNCVPQNACTLFDGNQTINTRVNGSNWELFDDCRSTPISVYDGSGVLISNNSTSWCTSGLKKTGASVLWATGKTYDYFLSKHNRNSYDNLGSSLRSNLQQNNSGADNAYWQYNTMNYGDGNGKYTNNPLVSLDVVGHEITHGVTEYNGFGGLYYAGESGALNESFSDIFGTMVEFNSSNNQGNYYIGEDMWLTGKLRDMQNPNNVVEWPQPDTYLGTNWSLLTGYGEGVHLNSGVQNFWFYLLSEGGAGTNDINTPYFVQGIGREKAAAIAYRNLTTYLVSINSTYLDARNGSIQSAKDLYGIGSLEDLSTQNAWCAVGVGACAPPCQSNLVINSPISTSQDYRVSNLITASSSINNNLNVNFRAKQTILKPGFLARGNATGKFRAFYDPCGNLPSSRSFNNNYNNSEISKTVFEKLVNVIAILPNPSNGIFKISLNEISEGKIEVLDLYGFTIYKTDFKNQNEFEMNLQDRQKGIYIVKVFSGEQVFTSKIIKN